MKNTPVPYIFHHTTTIQELIMPTYTRKTIDQKIADAEAKLKKLKTLKSGKTPAVALTAQSEGMAQLLTEITAVATTHKTTIAEVIMAVARIKKTGLKIENAKQNRSKSFDMIGQ